MRTGVRLAFDVGKVRVGVARCDADAILAVPVTTLHRDRYGADLEEAADLVQDLDVLEVIVGLPRSMSGGSSRSTQDARRWAGELAALISPVPVRLVDERLSTVTAHRELHESGRREKSFRSVVDQAAAVVILEQALATERSTHAPAGEPVVPIQRGRQ
ncbi:MULTISPECIES: Holliday junction resolvase RuvX [unclassified Actinomyces]|uniref:Holliday junction resolvase RuvX n=1 Tax=unclassified Actinomyces TaxID=2609248 RepID=UPI0013739DF4|nr:MULTISPECIES: Holliday junction resolvase RuvX [unclassified Actinomyces]MBW3070217.1 Holliday junction resolvase RuvX [Actinomyces sp. 594]NDR52715.1 Holliday junction resolvase RuvX [Actinomyces sp. 565]QHO90937.1 Holliday junction resolvase RuvX [Actinomyces sp. 432]